MTLKPKSLIARTLALICTLGLVGAAWGGLPTITVSGNDVTISNDSGSHGNIATNNGGYDTLTIPAATDLDSGTVLCIKSISFGARTSGTAAPASITLAGVDSAAAQVTASGYTDRDKYTYVFETPCLMKVGTGSTISFKNASGNQVNVGLAASLTGSTDQDNYLFTALKSTGSWSVLTEIFAEKVTGYIGQTADGFNTTITSEKVYVSGVTGYWNTPDGLFGTVDELVVVDGAYQFGHKIVNGNSPRGGFPNRGTAFKKLSGTGTITNGDYASEPSPVICVCDTSEFAGSINIGNGTTRPTILFCTEGEISAGIETSLGATLQSLFTSETGRSRIYVSPGRTAATNAVVIVPAGKTWTAVNGIENRGEMVVNGTVSCKIVNSGKLIVNGTVTGMISGSGTVVVSEGATVPSIGSQRDFTGWTIDSSIPVKITMTTEEYGKGSVSVTGANGISSIPVLAPDGTTEVGTITLEAGAGTLETGVKTSGLSTWCDYEFNGDKSNTGVDETGLTSDVNTTTYPEIFNSSMLYTYTHPWRNISYPNSWTAVVRCTVPELENAVVVMFGTYGAGAIGLVAGSNPEEEMLLVSTPGSSATTSEAKHFTTLATMNVKDATTAQHVYVFTKDGTTVNVYCDGEKVLDNYELANATLGGGLQVGSLHGGVVQSNVHTGLVRFGAGESQISSLTLAQQQNARIDCMRMFDYIVSPEQIAALSVEFPAVKLYRATVAENAETSWTDLTWTPAWDGGNTQSKVILTTEGGATVALPESITVDEVQLDLAENSTLTLSGPGSLAVTQPITIEDGTLELIGTVTLTQDTTFNGSVVFNQFTKEGDGAIKLSNGATVGVDAELVVTPLGTYTCAEGTVADAAYTSGEGDVKLIPLASAVVSITQNGTTLYYSNLDTALGPLENISGISDDVEVVLLNGTTLPVGYDQALISMGYYISGSTITKAVAKCNNSTYPTLAAAVEAATDGATVTLLLASSEEITLNDKAITLSETANFSGTLAGNGTVTFATLPASALNFGNWTGTVAIPEITDGIVNFNNYGKSGSTVKLAGGMSGGWLANVAVDPAIEIPGDKDMIIASFSPSFANTFAALKGAGTLKITATANENNDLANVATWGESLNYSAYIRIADVSQFTGWMYNTADVGIAFGESKPAKNTTGGKFYVTGDVSIGELNVPGNSEFRLFGGGTLTMENSVVNGGDADIYGTLTVEDATLSIGKSTNVKWIILRNNAAVINLDGGTLSICRMTACSDYTVNFNGGVLQSYGSGSKKENIIGGTSDEGSHTITLNVLADGAIIDNVIDTAIAPEMTGVGLTKKGTGTLTLAAAPTFTGAISVEAGKVVLPKGTYTLAAGTVVESDDGTNMTLAPGVAITVPSVANTTVTVKIGDTELQPASDGKYYVVPGSTVVVTYTAETGYAISNGEGSYTLDNISSPREVAFDDTKVIDCRTYTWTAEVDNSWSTPGNWDCNKIPTVNNPVVFPAETAPTDGWVVYVGQDSDKCASMTVSGNVTMSLNDTQSDWSGVGVAGDITGTGTLTLWRSGINSYASEKTTISCPLVIKANGSDSFLQKVGFDVTGTVVVNSLLVVYDTTEFTNKMTLNDGAIVRSNGADWYGDKTMTAALTFSGGIEVAANATASFESSSQTVTGEVLLGAGSTFTLSAGTVAAEATFKLCEGAKLMVPEGASVTAEKIIPADDTNYVVVPCDGGYTVADANYEVVIPEVTGATATITVNNEPVTPTDGKVIVAYGSKIVVTYTANDDYAVSGNTVTIDSVDGSNKTISTAGVSCWVVAETWTGAANDGNWKSAGNWSHNVVPTESIAVTFPEGSYEVTVSNGGWDPRSDRDMCGTLTINGSLKLKNGSNNDCRLSLFGDVGGTGSLTLSHVGLDNASWPFVTLNINCLLYVDGSAANSWFENRDIGFNVVNAHIWQSFDSWAPSTFDALSVRHDATIMIGTSWTDGDNNFHQKGVTVKNLSVDAGKNATFTYSGSTTETDFTLTGNVTLGAGSSLTVPVTLGDNQFVKSETSYVKSESVEGGVKYTLDTYKTVTFSGEHMTVARTDSLGDAIKAGDTVTFTVAPEATYKVESVMVGDTELTPDNGIYSLVVNGNVEVAVTTALDLVTFTIEVPENTTAKVMVGETEVAADNEGKYTVTYGAEVTVTWTAEAGYVLSGASSTTLTASQETAAVAAPEGMAVAQAVAQIGNDYYATLQAAVDQGDVTVKILGDVTLADKLVVDGRQTVVFEAVSAVTVTGQLRVVDGSNCTIGQNVTFTSADHPTVFVLGDPAVKTPGTDKSILVVNGTVANTNPTFDGAFAISGNGLDTQGVNITINGTVTNPKGIAIYQPQPGSLTVNGTVSGASAISIKDGTLTVGENAVVKAVLVNGLSYIGNNNGESPTGDAIIAPYYPASKGYGTPVVNIQGGKITVADTANCAGIEAYDFNGVAAPEDASSNVNVSGGTFNTPVELKYCAEGFIPAAADAQGKYGVEAGYVITWVVDDVETKMPVKPNVTPSYGENAPTKVNYTFNGWDPAVVAATENATYTATWTANGVTLGTPAVVWGADFTNAVVSATVADGYDDVAYTLTYNSNVYAGTVENGKVTFNVPVDEDDRYEDFSYTIDAKFGDSSVGTADGSAIVADKTAWFSATATTTTDGKWAPNPTVEGGRMTFSDVHTFTPTAASSGKIVVIDMGKVVFGDTNDTEINDAQAGIRIGSSGKFEVMSATGWTPTTVEADGEAVYNVVVSIDYKAKTYSVKVGNDIGNNTISGIALASSATKVTSIEFNGAGSLESLTGEYFEGAMVKDAKGATYDTVADAIAAYAKDSAIAPLTMLHPGTAPQGWTINEKGVLTQASIVVESTDDKTLVAVPQGCTSIDDLIDLSNRFKGDQIQVYDSKTGKFNTWELSAAKKWEGVGRQDEDDVPSVYPTDADKVLNAGQAVWVLRTTDASKAAPIKLNATYAETKAEVALETGWNLVAPTVDVQDLNSLDIQAAPTDRIVVPSANGSAPAELKYKNGKWGYNKAVKDSDGHWVLEFVTEDITIPAGTGFWYVSGSDKNINL